MPASSGPPALFARVSPPGARCRLRRTTGRRACVRCGRAFSSSSSSGGSSGSPVPSAASTPDLVLASSRSRSGSGKKNKVRPRAVGYSWVSCVADVDFEGGDVREALGALVSMLEGGVVLPEVLIAGAEYGRGRVLGLERATEAFDGGLLEGGGTVVVRVGE
ncbi:hypothetical protein EVG20_g5077 [Dentipellis fragilis]|uniref:Uncharacterized protein n=1 Tax=Dentipellis fragilis TaxID=205917 RepID=A0A4Y9YTX2_9AGAM|nr:hypothetical protein EVG20_g5077 [Dentipellis fragilis]